MLWKKTSLKAPFTNVNQMRLWGVIAVPTPSFCASAQEESAPGPPGAGNETANLVEECSSTVCSVIDTVCWTQKR